MRIIDFQYVNSQRKTVFSQKARVALEKRGFHPISKGSPIMVKPSRAEMLVELEGGGAPYFLDLRPEILRYYHLKSLRKERFFEVKRDLKEGKIQLGLNLQGDFILLPTS